MPEDEGMPFIRRFTHRIKKVGEEEATKTRFEVLSFLNQAEGNQAEVWAGPDVIHSDDGSLRVRVMSMQGDVMVFLCCQDTVESESEYVTYMRTIIPMQGEISAVTGDKIPDVVWARVGVMAIDDSLRRDRPDIAVAVFGQLKYALDATVRTKGQSLACAQKSEFLSSIRL
jgi:hypothetical protein